MRFGREWSDSELLMLQAALARSFGSYSGLTVVYGDLLIEMCRRGLLKVVDTP